MRPAVGKIICPPGQRKGDAWRSTLEELTGRHSIKILIRLTASSMGNLPIDCICFVCRRPSNMAPSLWLHTITINFNSLLAQQKGRLAVSLNSPSCSVSPELEQTRFRHRKRSPILAILARLHFPKMNEVPSSRYPWGASLGHLTETGLRVNFKLNLPEIELKFQIASLRRYTMPRHCIQLYHPCTIQPSSPIIRGTGMS